MKTVASAVFVVRSTSDAGYWIRDWTVPEVAEINLGPSAEKKLFLGIPVDLWTDVNHPMRVRILELKYSDGSQWHDDSPGSCWRVAD